MRCVRVAALGCSAALILAAQYAGPAILSRGQAPTGLVVGGIPFRPFVSATAIYDTGLGGIAVTDSGELAQQASFGQTLAGGVSGSHQWRRTLLGLDYRGSVTRYTRDVAEVNHNHSLLLGVTHQLSRRAILILRESAGVFSREYGVARLAQTVPFDATSSYIPTTDFFDNRTYFATTQADVTYQKSLRLSFTAGGDGFIVRRRSRALQGTLGAVARGDVQYRLSRHSTIGAGYVFNHFHYTRADGGSFAHGVIGTYASRLSATVEFTGYAGIMRIESKFMQTTPVDPLIAALLGITSTRQIVHQLDWRPNVGGRISKRFKTGIVYANGGHTITPGNGLFVTSYTTSILGGYNYTGLRRWAVSAQGWYSRSGAIGLLSGTYGTTNLRATVSRSYRRGLHTVASFGLRRYDSPTFGNYNRLIYQASLGIAFTPRDIALRVW